MCFVLFIGRFTLLRHQLQNCYLLQSSAWEFIYLERCFALHLQGMCPYLLEHVHRYILVFVARGVESGVFV